MSSKATAKRGKKTQPPIVNLIVIGAPCVGKSALSVRFLTKRFIAEYDLKKDTRHHRDVTIDNEPVTIVLLDMGPKTLSDLPLENEVIQWADGFVLTYSITDRESFSFIRRVKQTIQLTLPTTLVGNKSDMVHLRQVSHEEGEILAKDFDCSFAEVSAAEQVDEVAELFYELAREVIAGRRPKTLLGRMLSRPAYRYNRGKSDSALPKE